MKLCAWAIPLSLMTALLVACKPGYNRPKRPADSGQKPPECAVAPSNVNLNARGEQIFRVLANLTCFESTTNGNMLGQSLGSGTKIADTDDDKSYDALVERMVADVNATPVVVNTDYAFDERYSVPELTEEVNNTLEQHWLKGGLVSISWSPLNPWIPDDQTTAYSDEVDLAALIDPSSDIYDTWIEHLDEMGEALDNMRRRGIVVLWRPLPEMNDDRFWWGVQASSDAADPQDASLYTAVWEQMYRRLTDEWQLHNLLWVYSPVDRDSTVGDAAKSSTWAYAEDYTDIVAPIVRADSLQISEYEALLELGRPFALSEWAPSLINNSSLTKRFDALAYSDRLRQSYPFVAYWTAPYSQQITDDDRSYQALPDLLHLEDLIQKNEILTLEKSKSEGLLSEREQTFDTTELIVLGRP